MIKSSGILFILVLFMAVNGLEAQNTHGYKEGFNMVWHDEFLDSNTTNAQWERLFPWGPFTTEQSYGIQTGNHLFENGQLSLLNKKEQVNGVVYAYDSQGNFAPYNKDFNYTMAMLYSQQSFLRGYFEAGFKSDPGKGFYNAFWLYGEKECEIDVFELAGSDPYDAQMTLHWKDADSFTGSKQSIAHLKSAKHFGEQQHTFGTLWTSNTLTWFHNGVEVPQTAFTKSVRRRHIPDVPLNIIVNSAIASFDGLPDSTTILPGAISFDFVRAYQNETVVRSPVITAQVPLLYRDYAAVEFSLEWLAADDYYKTYPYGFMFEILDGPNYSTDGTKFTITQGFKDPVYLNVRIRDGINWSAISSVLVSPDMELAINDNAGTKAFKIYPNPNSGSFTVDNLGEGLVKMEIRSIEGKLVHVETLNSRTTIINLTGLSKGFYLLNLSQGNEVYQSKLIIE